MDRRDSVLSAPRYPVDWRDSVFLATRYPVDWRDSVLLALRVPWGLVGLGPFGHHVTLGLEDMAGHADQEIYCVYVYPGGLQPEV